MPRDPTELFPESEFVRVPSVPVFKEHKRRKSGRDVEVKKADLDAIANNVNREFSELGVAVPLTLGHTKDTSDGSEVSETDQPEIVGWSVNYRTDKLQNGEDALYCDWYVRKEHSDVIRRYPTRSVEYYVGRQTVWPVALLKSTCPELSLPILKYRYGKELQPGEEPPIQFEISVPYSVSTSPKESDEMPTDDKMDDKKPTDTKSPEDKAVDKAQKSEEKGSKSDAADLQEIKAQLSQIMAVMPEIMELVSLMKEGPEGAEGQDDDSDDLLGPADAEDKSAPTPKEKDKDVVDGKDTGSPVKCDAAMPSATNCSIPGYKKEDYKMTDDEKLKYKAEIKAELEKEAATKYAALENQYKANQKVVEKLAKESRLLKAKEMVKDLEEVHMIQYSSDAVRNEDVEMLAKLDEEAAKKYVEMAKVRYQKKLPDSTEVQKVAKYAVEGEPDFAAKTPEEAQERALKALSMGLSMEEFYKKAAEGKK